MTTFMPVRDAVGAGFTPSEMPYFIRAMPSEISAAEPAMSPMSPRQGFKSSGVGIEHGTETIREYTRLKSVWINTSEEPVADPFVLRS